MPANVVQAMSALAEYRANRIDQYTEGYKIGINSSGSMFEEYVKDLLTGRFYSSPQERAEAQEKEFSWLGSQNFPPDAIARGGDAFEIKKHEKPAGTIALNSSPPKGQAVQQRPHDYIGLQESRRGQLGKHGPVLHCRGSSAREKGAEHIFCPGDMLCRWPGGLQHDLRQAVAVGQGCNNKFRA